MTIFNKIYKASWLVLILLIIFFDRYNIYWVVITIILLLLLSGIAVLRSLEARNEWRKYIEEQSMDEELM